MTFLEAAEAVLKQVGRPMKTDEIVKIATNNGWLSSGGKTPEQTMNAQLCVHINRGGKVFVRTSPGYYGLAENACASDGGEEKESSSATEVKLWGIHCVVDEERMFRERGVIAIGWHEMGDLSALEKTREAYKDAYAKVWSGATKQSVATQAGQVFRFVCEAQVGDYVVFPSKADRKINIGQITGTYVYDTTASQRFVQQRKVKWLKTLSRTAFSQGALYEVGSAITFFQVKNYADEYLSALGKNFKPVDSEDVQEEVIAASAEDISQRTEDFILKELSKSLKGYSLEDFTRDLFEAMGYKAVVSKKGGDRGIDITAYRDELPPRIIIQVKSQDGDIPERYVSQLGGTLRTGDYGVFVCLSDFSANARAYLLEHPHIKGINGRDFAALILKYYDQLPESARKIIPLKKVYIPVVLEG